MKFRKQSYCVYKCENHLVFATKYRRKIFNEEIFAYLLAKVNEVRDYYPEIDVLEINHDADHVHMLVSIPPKFSVSKAVSVIKANTSRGIKVKFPFLKDVYWGTDGIWSDGYFVPTVGIRGSIQMPHINDHFVLQPAPLSYFSADFI